MGFRFSFAILFAAFLLSASPKKTSGSAHGENEDLILTVTLYTDPADIRNLLGSDLGGHYFVADVKVEPKYGKEISVDRDDFVLRTDKDGEKAKPFAPTQIAGRGVLVVRETGGGGGMMGESGGPMIGMGGPMGGPMGYPGGGTFGAGGGGEASGAEAKVDNGTKQKENPLVKVLQEKVLPEKKTDQPISGLLYFPLEKQKVKDLELSYGGRENRITMRFK